MLKKKLQLRTPNQENKKTQYALLTTKTEDLALHQNVSLSPHAQQPQVLEKESVAKKLLDKIHIPNFTF